jgi:hypothetical protein
VERNFSNVAESDKLVQYLANVSLAGERVHVLAPDRLEK